MNDLCGKVIYCKNIEEMEALLIKTATFAEFLYILF